jgi:hypothetical protein
MGSKGQDVAPYVIDITGSSKNRVKALMDEIEQGINVEENKAELFQVYGIKYATGGKTSVEEKQKRFNQLRKEAIESFKTNPLSKNFNIHLQRYISRNKERVGLTNATGGKIHRGRPASNSQEKTG